MLRSNNPRETPSPSYHPLLQAKSTAKAGRKSAVASSFHQFAKNALQPLKRRQADEGAVNGGAYTTTIGSGLRSSSLPVRARGISLPLNASNSPAKPSLPPLNTSNGPANPSLPPLNTSKSPAKPSLPLDPARWRDGPTSSILKPAPAADFQRQQFLVGIEPNENMNPFEPEHKPFIGYQDLKALPKAAGHFAGANAKIKTPLSPSPGSISSISSQDTMKPAYRTGIPISKSSSFFVPTTFKDEAPPVPRSVFTPVPGYEEALGLIEEREKLALEAFKKSSIEPPGEMQEAAIDQHEGNSVNAFKPPKPSLAPPRRLPKSKTLGFLSSKPKAPVEDLWKPKLDGFRCYREDPDAEDAKVDKFSFDSGSSFSLETPSSGETYDLKVVKTAKPQQYWLGRLVTLINSFHHEAAFNEPDPVTGYGVAGNKLEGKAPLSVNLDDYYTKRAFMVLERACFTPEASASLTEFKNAYSRRFGRKFSQRYTGEIDKVSPKSEKSTGKNETGMMNILRSVRKSFG